MKPKRVQITTTLEEGLLRKLRHIAVDKNLNLNDLIEEAIRGYWFKDEMEGESPVSGKEKSS